MQSMEIIRPKITGSYDYVFQVLLLAQFLFSFLLFFFFFQYLLPSKSRVARPSPRMGCYTGVGWTLVFTLFFDTSSFGLKIVSRNEQGFCHFFIMCKMLGMFKSNSNQSNREQEIGETFIPLETALFPLHFYRSIDVFCLLWHQKQLFQTSGIFLSFTRAAYTGCESRKMDFNFKILYHCYQQDSVTNTTFS